jgi:FkbM family methyltransferase
MGKIKRTFGFIFNHPLSKRHIVRSFASLLLWQVQSALRPDKFYVKPFIKPVKFYARKGLTGITGNIYSGLHEFDDMAFLLHFLRPGDVFFDVGANVGSYSLLALGVCGAKTVSMEPIEPTFNILMQNIALNHLGENILAINAAAGGEEGKLLFTSAYDTGNHVAAKDEPDANVVSVPVITIDSLTAGKVPVLVKIDVEGYETEVLKGMTETLDKPDMKALIIELNGSGARYGYDEAKLHELLLSKQFSACRYDPFTRSLKPVPTFGSFNTIYCRDIDFVEQRIRTADGVRIMGETI